MALRVLVADDHALMLEAIRRILGDVADIAIVAEAQSGRQVLPLLERTKPDLVVLDLNMPGMDGLLCLERIRARHPSVKVVILSASTEPERIDAAFRRGANAYILKTIDPVDLPSALRQAAAATVFHAFGQQPDPSLVRDAGLTEREVVMLKALARGLSNHSISREFWVTEQTVKFHLTNIYRKLGVANRTEAARYAFDHGLVDSHA
jgi:NarL family two-component system response regulator LiaR